VETNNSSYAGVAEERKRIFAREAGRRLEYPTGLFQQPTAHEMSCLVFRKLRDPPVNTQEARNHFAHLLNRGSSLE
jgi:hypothetical protein